MRILIIEDDASLTELLAYGLEAENFTVDICHDGQEGLILALQNMHDMILLDRMLPGMPGEKILQRIRKNNVTTPVIFITALGEPMEKIAGLDLGADNYLVKPFDDEKLAEVLARAVGQYEDNRKREEHKKKERETSSLVITRGGEHVTVRIEDIVYAEVFDRKVIIHTMDSDIEYYGKMKELEQKVGDGFYRPHRAYLVNLNFIRKYDAATIYLKRGQALMAKQNYHDFVKSYLRFNQKEPVCRAEGGRRE